MKRILLSITILSFSIVGNSQVECKKFRNGTFFYPGMPEKLSVRADSVQKSYNQGRLEMIWKIKWLSDCKYEMICQEVFVEASMIGVGDRIVVNIESTNANCYTSSLVFYSKEIPEGEKLPGGELCVKKATQ